MQQILGKKLLLITAHPDDESFWAAGTIYQNYKHGGQTAIICATLGEKGKYYLKRNISEKELKSMRKKELERVSKFLKVKNLFILNLPDGKLEQYKDKFFSKTASLLSKINPELLVGFGLDGITGHYDHLAAHGVAKKISKNFKIPLYCFCPPPKILPKITKWLFRRRRNDCYCETIHYEYPTIKIAIDQKIKMRAMKMHVSQIHQKNPLHTFPKEGVDEVLKAEYFVSSE